LGIGNYIAYITTADITIPTSNMALAASNSNGGLGGSFWFSNSDGVDPLTVFNNWTNYADSNLQFVADITPATNAVPLPGAASLLGLGVIALAGSYRRRR
jgi:hypothetical protein